MMRADDFFDQLAEESPVPGEIAAEVDLPFVLAGNVYRLRVARGLSQAQLAARLGVSQPRIAEIERGDANPLLATLGKLAYALGVRPSDLLDPGFQPPVGEPASAVRTGWSNVMDASEPDAAAVARAERGASRASSESR